MWRITGTSQVKYLLCKDREERFGGLGWDRPMFYLHVRSLSEVLESAEKMCRVNSIYTRWYLVDRGTGELEVRDIGWS